ncbi:MAG: PQQ-binding-like beta-propeller repeat protein [Pseudomonadota bacterium]
MTKARCLTFRAVTAAALCAVIIGCGTGPKVKPPEPDELRAIQAASVEPSVLWSAKVGDGSQRSVVRYTPYVTTDRVFSVNAKGLITALDRSNGQQVWEASIGARPTAGVSGDDRYLFLGTGDGKVFSIDQQDGSTVWSTNVSSEVIAAPAAGNGFVVVRSIDGRVYSLDKQNGTRRWIYTYSVPALSLHGNGRPLVVPDGVLVGAPHSAVQSRRRGPSSNTSGCLTGAKLCRSGHILPTVYSRHVHSAEPIDRAAAERSRVQVDHRLPTGL